jgi:hypothetical protein
MYVIKLEILSLPYEIDVLEIFTTDIYITTVSILTPSVV